MAAITICSDFGPQRKVMVSVDVWVRWGERPNLPTNLGTDSAVLSLLSPTPLPAAQGFLIWEG